MQETYGDFEVKNYQNIYMMHVYLETVITFMEYVIQEHLVNISIVPYN